MQGQHQIAEIVGRPGKVWGTVFVPSAGTITVKITGDMIHATFKSGLEKSETWVRIQNVDSVEMGETINYALLVFGVVMTCMGLGNLTSGETIVLALFLLLIGAGCIAATLQNKRRLLTIYSHRATIPVFMTKPQDSYRQFANQVMTIARQLNTSTPVRSTNGQSPNQRPGNGQTSANPRIQVNGQR